MLTINRFAHMILAGALLTGAFVSAETTTTLSSVSETAKKTQSEAREIATMLKAGKPDFEAIRSRMATLEAHSTELNQMVVAAEPTFGSQPEFAKVRDLAKIVAIFVENKKAMLSSSDATKNRQLLRAKAEGIAQRAQLIERATQKLRG